VQRIGVAGLALQQLAVERLGFAQAPSLVVRQGVLQHG
jgi:hypothetical protein